MAAALLVLASGAGATDPACDPRAEASMAPALQRSLPSVVRVLSARVETGHGREDLEERWQPGAAVPGSARARPLADRVAASGFIVDAGGLVATSAHGVRRALGIWVITADERSYRARVIGVDAALDLALLRIDPPGLPALAGAAGTPRVGDRVVAVGAPFGFEQSVTSGIVSAWPRLLPGGDVAMIQSDVALNPGSSGGPLLNACGEFVGMSSMVFSNSGFFLGVSFAVPAHLLAPAIERMRRGVQALRIGARMQTLTPPLARAFGLPPDTAGAVLLALDPDGAAARAGLASGDVIERVDGWRVTGAEAMPDAWSAGARPQPVVVDFWRDGRAAQALLVLQTADGGSPEPGLPPVPGAWPRLGLDLAPSGQARGLAPGAWVVAVAGPALLAGVEEGDRIVAVNGRAVRSPESFDAALEQALAAGRPFVALLLIRDGVPLYVAVPRVA